MKARAQRHSDDHILQAARGVLLREGPIGFTLQAVATAAGMSRSALTLRVQGREHLLRWIGERGLAATQGLIEQWPPEAGVQSLWRLLLELVALLGPARGHAGRWPLDGQDGGDPELARLAQERNRLVLQAIARRLPARMPAADANASMLQAVMTGAAAQWRADEGPMDTWVIEHLRVGMCLLFPGERFALPAGRAATAAPAEATVVPQAVLASSR